MRRLLLVALAACTAPPAPPLQAAAPAPGAPPTQPPSIRWAGERGFAVDRLPAIAAGGRVIVFGVKLEDGARGEPNLAIVVKDRSDAQVQQQVVLAVDEAEAMIDDRGPSAALAQRIAAGNDLLADLHRTYDLVPLHALVIPTGDEDGTGRHAIAIGHGLRVAWKPSRVVIERDGRSVVDRATPSSWLANPRANCTNEAFLAGAYGDAARAAVVLVIGYTGTDLCWEPDHQDHVVTW